MNQLATITSKLQLTLPVALATKVGVKSGEKVSVSEEDGKIIITPMRQLVESLAGSISVSKDIKGKDVDKLIRQAKETYFHIKYSKTT